MQFFLESILVLFGGSAVHGLRQNIAMLFAPGGVVDLGHDGFEGLSAWVVAVVEADGVEAVSEVGELREQSDRSFGAVSGHLLDEGSDGTLEAFARVALMIAAAEVRQAGAFDGPERVATKTWSSSDRSRYTMYMG